MINDGNSDIAEVLKRIRARLQTRIEADLHAGDQVSQSSDSPSRSIGFLQGLLASMQFTHLQVGVVNPRNPGLINNLIQIVKKSLRRALTWYTRSIIEFQAATIRLLAETVEILGRDQSRLATLEKKIETLTAELASLRQQIQSRPELVVRDPSMPEMEKK
jgi:hypothetical protein